jgi:hypothetical protein
VIKLVERLRGEDHQRLAKFRTEVEALVSEYYEPERNVIRMDYLMTRATKA